MNATTRPWTYLAIGTCSSIAGLVVLVAAVAAASPVGLAVGGVVGGSFAFGLIASCIKAAVARRGSGRGGRGGDARAPIGAPALAQMRFAEAANETEVAGARDFAPVASLVEAQLRRRSALRDSEQERAALTRA